MSSSAVSWNSIHYGLNVTIQSCLVVPRVSRKKKKGKKKKNTTTIICRCDDQYTKRIIDFRSNYFKSFSMYDTKGA